MSGSRTLQIHEDASGFTLLEIMIALTIFSIGILAMAGLAITSMSAITKAHGTLFDTVAAARHIEDILSRSYDDAILEDVDAVFETASPDHGPVPISGRSTIEWEVHDDFPIVGSKRICITVRRMERGDVRTFTYAYCKAKDFR